MPYSWRIPTMSINLVSRARQTIVWHFPRTRLSEAFGRTDRNFKNIVFRLGHVNGPIGYTEYKLKSVKHGRFIGLLEISLFINWVTHE
ncbi:predicted protein [Sclerotinia sclerotiorum 1980 UF-70]|uniref:Uncharacterized protein n=1 Tax=Sclerotinia sclerotiorum (strain ATCC 18683 / 1980 / Ss-1) TaxID=665079 RepID=A7F9G4_SCLS1|nr:predicted protein [Sclerotinia sclerotiorum 1980 UF-70]EDO00375.1 predicted protein [Sclerotinia sclerotiorum 1980 UF-70]